MSEQHKKEALKTVKFAFVTVSTSRYGALRRGEEVNDISFRKAREIIEKSGHILTRYILVPDSPRLILSAIDALLDEHDVDAIIVSGGTGPTPDDLTVQTLRPLFEKELEGFGDLFRLVSSKEVGSSSYLSNATAGIIAGKVVFCLPGSPGAVEKALRELIIPEVGHILSLARRVI
ncbi:molybdenum cofactor biosynthesis protein MoaB [Infirmifilum lucidum]|uniref:Molybdenum cofactor biosynthesis protein MoaB n=1 Tax=Infirmifilum lucidum TaxID=2776706 RepID=A0A7L9FET8_9CREN|nr:molybdenum cofactor biosynthesis protein B [Infirmifilum lucidum]QOJ78318.1 molybdenum cofactor biosynthesis protein MoaB [Infirmifilum lucidum]